MAESKEETSKDTDLADTVKNKYINIKDLKSEISHLGNENSSDEDYPKVLECLGYENPTSISSAQFDAILIKAVKTKLKGIRAEFTLMALGLLSGYERVIDIGTRRLNYLQSSNYTLEFGRNRRPYDDANPKQQEHYMKSLIKAEGFYIEKLADFLAEKMKKGQFDEFIKDLSDYYNPDTKTPILPEPKPAQKKKIKSPQNEPGESDVHGNAKDKRLFYMRHMTIALYSLVAVLIFVHIIKPWWTEKANAEKAAISPPVPAETISSTEASSDNSLLVEMETFSIDEVDKVIPLAPGYSRELPIKNPEPSNADMSTLKVESSDESIVLWDKDRLSLTALDNIPEGVTHKVYVTITAKNHREIICIEVKEFVISDDAEGPIGGGE